MTGLLTGSLVLDLGREAAEADRREVYTARLDEAPAGTRVVILVGRRHPSLDGWVLDVLRDAAKRLALDVRANDGDTITAWHRAIRGDAA